VFYAFFSFSGVLGFTLLPCIPAGENRWRQTLLRVVRDSWTFAENVRFVPPRGLLGFPFPHRASLWQAGSPRLSPYNCFPQIPVYLLLDPLILSFGEDLVSLFPVYLTVRGAFFPPSSLTRMPSPLVFTFRTALFP